MFKSLLNDFFLQVVTVKNWLMPAYLFLMHFFALVFVRPYEFVRHQWRQAVRGHEEARTPQANKERVSFGAAATAAANHGLSFSSDGNAILYGNVFV
jgi:hypothetical protein